MNKILLITYHPLTAINGGTFMYKSIIHKIPENELVWICTGTDNTTTPNWITGYRHYIFPSFIFKKIWLRVFRKFPFSLIHYLFLYFFYSSRVSKEIIKIVENENIKLIWIEGVKHTYKIGTILSRRTNIPIHLSINDDYRAQTGYIENRFILKNYFKWLLTNSKSIDFISEGMIEQYQHEFGLVNGNHKVFWIGNESLAMQVPIIKKEIKKIIFYGSLHGLDSIKNFCIAISKLNHIKYDLVLDIYSGTDYSFLEKISEKVHYKGHVPVDALKKIIQDYDLIYVPLSFEKKQKIVVKTSVPSKMILALQCQIPILAHGPAYAQNIRFVELHKVGIALKSNIVDEIINELVSIKYETRLQISENQSSVYKDYFNTEERVVEFVNNLKSSSI